MRSILFLLLCSALVTGCARDKAAQAKPPGKSSAASRTKETSTPSRALVGRVARVNAGDKIAVLTYPLGPLPPVDQKLNVYRGGAKVGEIKISRERQDINVVADILAGEIQVGDEVRED